MSPAPVLAAAAIVWGVAAVIALTTASPRAGLRLACLLSGLGGLAALYGGAWSLISGSSRLATPGGSSVVGSLQLQVTPLAGAFIALLGLVAAAIAWYAPRYHEQGRGTAIYLGAYNLALAASLAVLTAGGMVTFLVAWESMALLCYLVILRRPSRDDVAAGAFWFLALSEIGFVLIAEPVHMGGVSGDARRPELVQQQDHLAGVGVDEDGPGLRVQPVADPAGRQPVRPVFPLVPVTAGRVRGCHGSRRPAGRRRR
jgi:NADH:ubiquinone oxidoreductase subunit 2 (subunit N)